MVAFFLGRAAQGVMPATKSKHACWVANCGKFVQPSPSQSAMLIGSTVDDYGVSERRSVGFVQGTTVGTYRSRIIEFTKTGG